ncbi:hypothetical protein EV421DRAFT_1768435, partial [Armillaria borealis]
MKQKAAKGPVDWLGSTSSFRCVQKVLGVVVALAGVMPPSAFSSGMQPSWRHIFWIGFPLSLITAEIGKTGVSSWRITFFCTKHCLFFPFFKGTSLHRFLGKLDLV